jgi:hypothetical protein
MTHEEFKVAFRLNDVADSCGDRLFAARKLSKGVVEKDRPETRNHITIWDSVTGKNGVLYVNVATRAQYNSIERQLVALGGVPGLRGDCDGYIHFDPTDKKLVNKVLRVAKIRVKRVLTDEQRSKLADRLTRKG